MSFFLLRKGDWKYVVWGTGSEVSGREWMARLYCDAYGQDSASSSLVPPPQVDPMLFNITADPGEMDNVWKVCTGFSTFLFFNLGSCLRGLGCFLSSVSSSPHELTSIW